MAARNVSLSRKTNETDINLSVNLDGTGDTNINTGIGFLDHLFESLAKHARFDLKLTCKGDLKVDDHHTAEDCAIVLGEAINKILDDRAGIARFGYAYAPLDEALARTVIDLSGRPFCDANIGLCGCKLGDLSSEMVSHVFTSLANRTKASIHVDVLKGDNDHHKAEAAFKSLALALRAAVAKSGADVPSTKGVL